MLIELNVTREDFKKDMSEVELAGLKAIVSKHFEGLLGESYNVVDGLGLFYTSSGSHAMLNSQDGEFEIADGVALSHFALTHNHIVVAVGYDKEEEEKFYRIN